MAPSDLRSIRRVAGWTAGCGTAAVTVACVAQDPDHVVIVDLLLAAWLLAPALAAGGLVAASSTRLGAAAFLGLELFCVGATVLVAVSVTFFAQSAYDGLALFILPVGEWLVAAMVMVVASIAGWRERDETLSIR